MSNDVPPPELATYCLHALDAADSLTTGAAVRQLIELVNDTLQPRD